VPDPKPRHRPIGSETRCSVSLRLLLFATDRYTRRILPLQKRSPASAVEWIARALRHSAAPSLVVTPDGRVAAASAGATRLLGDALCGRAVRDIVGVSWRELEFTAREPDCDLVVELARGLVRSPTPASGGWRLRPDLLLDDDRVVALVAHLAEAPDPLTSTGVGSPGTTAGGAARRGGRAAVSFAALFGTDAQVVEAKRIAERFAKTRLPILLLAETGTGKDLLARAIHAASPRAERPFVAINCGALSPHLLESELFGYGPGAFTDARREGHEGKIGAARGGTLFLDEVAEMPGPLQALLLRVLEDGTYFRVGENAPRQADVRLICATCRDLPAMVEEGSFRRDLFFRVAGACLTLPPVRRRDDVAELVRHVLAGLEAEDTSRAAKMQRTHLARTALARMEKARWPGNVRQIKTALQYALALADGGEIRLEHLPRFDDGSAGERLDDGVLDADHSLGRSSGRSSGRSAEGSGGRLADLENQLVERTLAEVGGNVSLAARRLGIARTTLYRHLRSRGAAR
jgi:DNA-binding NtrC family response regulator